MNKPFQPPSATAPMRSTAVRFTNGMIVTDDDLTAAMHYPVQLLQAVNRGVYGCGVVCGFRFSPDPDLCGRKKRCDPCNDEDTREAYPGFVIEVGRGTAIDCDGMPIELCEPILVDVTPERCGCEGKDGKVCIAVRRRPVEDSPRGDCCADPAGPQPCSRLRDYVELRAFPADDLPDHICGHVGNGGAGSGCGCAGQEGGTGENGGTGTPESPRALQDRICDCLRDCDACDCCGGKWILLGCVEYCAAGILVTNFPPSEEGKMPSRAQWSSAMYNGRKWVKTVECLCAEPWQREEGMERYDAHVAGSEPYAEETYRILSEVGIPEDRAVTLALTRVEAAELPAYIRANSKPLQRAFKLKGTDVLDGYAAEIEALVERRRS